MTAALGISSLEDFVHYVAREKYEAELIDLVNSCQATKDSRLVVARLRAAWKAGAEAIETAASLTSRVTQLRTWMSLCRRQALRN